MRRHPLIAAFQQMLRGLSLPWGRLKPIAAEKRSASPDDISKLSLKSSSSQTMASFAIQRAALLRAGFTVKEKPCMIPVEPRLWLYSPKHTFNASASTELKDALRRFGFPLLQREEEKKQARYYMNIFAALPHVIREDGGRRESIPVLRQRFILPARHITQGKRPHDMLMGELKHVHEERQK